MTSEARVGRLPVALLAVAATFGVPAAPAEDVGVVLDESVLARVRDASQRGHGYDVLAMREVALDAAAIVAHPGARVVIGDSCAPLTSCASCTLGFLYGSHGSYRFVTAKHCVVGDAAFVIPLPGVLVQLGTPGSSPHALLQFIDVLPSMQGRVDPDGWALGTTGVHREPFGGAEHLTVFSWGQPWGPGVIIASPADYVGAPRAGIIFAVDPASKTFQCTCAFALGDSGGPIWDTAGRAIGIVESAGPFASATLASAIGEDPVAGDRIPIDPGAPGRILRTTSSPPAAWSSPVQRLDL